MKTFIKRWSTNERLAILLPLGGFKIFWLAVAGAAVADLFVYPSSYRPDGSYIEVVRLSTYLWLLAIGALALASAWGRSKAFASKPSRLAHLAKGFTTFAVIASLIVGAIYGIGTFMSALNMNAGIAVQRDPLVRTFGVYVPILLDALLLIAVILWAFVGKVEKKKK